jgi:hypothetical protein
MAVIVFSQLKNLNLLLFLFDKNKSEVIVLNHVCLPKLSGKTKAGDWQAAQNFPEKKRSQQ